MSLVLRGRRESRMPECTRSLACRMKSIRVNHHRFTGSRRLSPRNGFNGLLRALPGVHDFLVTVIGAMQSIVANLAPAKGCQNHTTSPSAKSIDRLAMLPRPPHPAPRFVTIRAYAPLRGRDSGEKTPDLGISPSEFFFSKGLDDPNQLESSGEIRLLEQQRERQMFPQRNHRANVV